MLMETELERQARRERDSWDRFRRNREEDGIQEDGNDRGREKEIFINGERYVKHEPRDSYYSHKESSGPPPPSVATESTTGDDGDGISQLGRFLESLGGRMHLGSNPASGSQEPERRVKTEEEERVKMKTEPPLTRLLGLFPGLNLFGNNSVPPPPPPSPSSSHSRSSRGSSRGQSLPKSRYPKKNTAEVMAEFKASPNPFQQAYQERRSWRNERPSGVEYVECPAESPASSYSPVSYPRTYPPPPTAVTVSESDTSSLYQQEFENEDPTHRVYRVPSYRINPTGDTCSQQRRSEPTAHMRRRRRRGLGEDSRTVLENGRHP
ncbi:hypothetical protein QBC32DRAFT_220261 [Pseudoneurospora amorphoporcata]|uniref:Uncharacterized protein n=1 Tax=Pseudoneurospora amorphoporcata TaxID=241081 RepID=A0AAN6NP29_9PEZI|nr:hypothetical protein QBC32DRAFT_220261 [Pseudoneurospora amorphoporcata]